MSELFYDAFAQSPDPDLWLETISRLVQADLSDPNLSETYKDAAIAVAEEYLALLPYLRRGLVEE